MLQATVVTDERGLVELAASWDELADELARPYCAPAWGLAWWHNARPSDARLRTVALTDGDDLIGIAPFYVSRGPVRSACYRLLGAAAAARVEPLARAGAEGALAEAAAKALAGRDSAAELVRLEGIPADSPWPQLLADAWPGRRPAIVEEQMMAAPVLEIAGRSFDEFLASRSGHFRKRTAAGGRKLEAAGGRIAPAVEPADVERGLRAFAELHHARFRRHGGSGVLTPGIERMVADVARELVPSDRFQLWLVDTPEGTIASEILLGAGAELSSWLGGFDEAWAKHQPSLQALFAAIEQAHRSGKTRVDLGPGAQDFKYRFANAEEMLRWVALVPRGRRSGLRRAALHASRLKRAASEHVPERPRRIVKRVLRRA